MLLKQLSRCQLENAAAALMHELGDVKAMNVLESVMRGSVNNGTLPATSSAADPTSSAVVTEAKRQKLNNGLMTNSDSSTTQIAAEKKEKKKKKGEGGMGFSMSRYSQRKIALWVAYFGHNYKGLASNGEDDDGTIESELFRAMKKTKLVDETKDREGWEYSRCGRTDAGVSGFSQIIALKMRSSNRPTISMTATVAPSASDVAGTTPVSAATTTPQLAEEEMLDYTAILNRVLPPDIMVLGHSSVRPDFDARFACTSRTYRYFFTVREGGLTSVESMRRACALLKGTHDFRNFCKMDVENVKSFVRTIEEARVELPPPGAAAAVGYVEIKGNAFLWHQIRMIMGVLFLIARGMETPEVITELLDVEKHPRRPAYQMAEDAPLVLCDVGYREGEFTWITSEAAMRRMGEVVDKRRTDNVIRAEMANALLNRLSSRAPFAVAGTAPRPPRESDHEEACGPVDKYVPLLARPGASTMEELQTKAASRRERRQQQQSGPGGEEC